MTPKAIVKKESNFSRRTRILAALLAMSKRPRDPETNQSIADDLLLQLIDDAEVAAAFNDIVKGRA